MMKQNKRYIKKLIKNFRKETLFISSVTNIYENKNYTKLEKISFKTKDKPKFFKLILSRLENDVFLYKLLENITGKTTVIKQEDAGKMQKIREFWYNYNF